MQKILSSDRIFLCIMYFILRLVTSWILLDYCLVFDLCPVFGLIAIPLSLAVYLLLLVAS